jgi:hypothetical protein
MLACYGAVLGQTKGTASAGRPLEQNEVLLLLRRLLWTGGILRERMR